MKVQNFGKWNEKQLIESEPTAAEIKVSIDYQPKQQWDVESRLTSKILIYNLSIE